jgi:hypothetical protein
MVTVTHAAKAGARLTGAEYEASSHHVFEGLPYVDVRDYGAVGNGVVDDTAAIQAAINAATGGGTVLLPAGTYGVSATLVLDDYVALIGQGIGLSTLFVLAGAAPVVITNADVVNGNPGLTIRGLTIDGNRANATGSSAHGIALYGCQDGLTLEDIEVHDCWGTGVYLSGEALLGFLRPTFIRGIDTHHNWVGFQISYAHRRTVIQGINAESNEYHGVVFDVTQLTASDITARYNGNGGGGPADVCGIWIRNIATGSFVNLVAELNYRHGIYVQGATNTVGSSWRAQGNGQLTSNTYDDVHFAVNGSGYGETTNFSLAGLVAGQASVIAASVGLDDDPAMARYGLYITDASTTGTVRIDGYVCASTVSGSLRRPAAVTGLSVNGDMDMPDLWVGPVSASYCFGYQAHTVANTAHFVPFTVRREQRVTTCIFGVGTASGNLDIGIYDDAGVRLGSTGSFACPTAGVAKTQALTGTVTLRPNTRYWRAVWADNTTVQLTASVGFGVQFPNGTGYVRCGAVTGLSSALASSVTLPTTNAGNPRDYNVTFV